MTSFSETNFNKVGTEHTLKKELALSRSDSFISKMVLKSEEKRPGGKIDLIMGPMFSGKCEAAGTEILMYDGSVKCIEHIQKGDLLMGDDSTPRKVLSISKGKGILYDILPITSLLPCVPKTLSVNKEHVLSLVRLDPGLAEELDDHERLTIVNFFGTRDAGLDRMVKTKDAAFEKAGQNFQIIDVPLKDFLQNREEYSDCRLFTTPVKFQRNQNVTPEMAYDIGFRSRLRKQNIPRSHYFSDEETNLATLAGIIDGIYTVQRTSDAHKDERIEGDFVFIAGLDSEDHDNISAMLMSLGMTMYYYKVYTGNGFSLANILLQVTKEIPCKIFKPHRERLVKAKFYPYSIGVNTYPPLDDMPTEEDYYGFTLDGNGRYLHSDLLVTHNTSELIRLYRTQKRSYSRKPDAPPILLVRHADDLRYSSDGLATHDKIIENDAVAAKKLSTIDHLAEKASHIYIDEGQFFENLSDYCIKWSRQGKHVHVAALDAYANQQQHRLWTEIAILIPFCEQIRKLNACCFKCGEPASLTMMIDGNKDPIKIGGNESYEACCINCTDKYNQN